MTQEDQSRIKDQEDRGRERATYSDLRIHTNPPMPLCCLWLLAPPRTMLLPPKFPSLHSPAPLPLHSLIHSLAGLTTTTTTTTTTAKSKGARRQSSSSLSLYGVRLPPPCSLSLFCLALQAHSCFVDPGSLLINLAPPSPGPPIFLLNYLNACLPIPFSLVLPLQVSFCCCRFSHSLYIQPTLS